MDLHGFQSDIGYSFNSEELLRRALTHSSRANESGCADNERLEFLGDAVIGFVVSEYLFEKFPERTEGELSALKAVLVSADFLGKIAEDLGFGSRLFLGRGEERSGGRRKNAILADAFEAVAAAVYIDGGIGKSREFVAGHLAAGAEKLDRDVHKGRYKGLLQEYAQSEYGVIPDYRLKRGGGEGERERFRAEVCVNGRILAEGGGRSKKQAETEAARKALEIIGLEESQCK